MHAVEFLKQVPSEIASIVVLSGGQRHLKQSALALLKQHVIDDDDTSLTRFSGAGDLTLQQVSDELHTVSMWGDKRLVVVEDADDFVSEYRAQLEKLVDKPPKKSVLVLSVSTWPKTTRLYKLVAAKGMDIDCSELKAPELLKWLQETAKDTYNRNLSRDAAALMVELVGAELGMLDTELAKLASYASDKGKIDINDVKTLVGGWRTETTWAMTDAVRDDDLSFALNALDQLLSANEPAPKLLGGISYIFKKFGQATDYSRLTPLDQALRQAGVFQGALGPGQSYLRRLGRGKAEQILQRLLLAESGIKGGSWMPDRMQLERLLIELAGRL